jgi:N-acetylmuramoyl-L-alanine amidase
MSFQDYVRAVAKTKTAFPQLKACMLAQSIMEAGREETDLAKLHNNHHGLKYRPEMEGYATPIDYATKSEPSGRAVFCKFPSKEAEVKGYWHFMGRDPYKGFEAHTATPREYLNFIGPTYCPPGFTKEWAKKHGGLNYTEYIVQKLLPEAEKLLAQYKEEEPEMKLKKVSWLEFNRTDAGAPFVSAYDEGIAQYTHPLTSPFEFFEWSKALNAEKCSIKVAETDKKSIPKCPDIYDSTEPVEPPKPPTKKKTTVLLDPGHSKSRVGARSNDGKVKEEVLNLHACETIKAELERGGYAVTMYDPDPDNLTAVGQKARGFDVVISWHHNQYKNGTENPYHCVMIDPAAPSAWKNIASRLAIAIEKGARGTCADTVVFSGTHDLVGVYEAELTVLNTSANDPDGEKPFHVLPEAYFLNKMTSVQGCMDASKAIALQFAKQLMIEFPN